MLHSKIVKQLILAIADIVLVFLSLIIGLFVRLPPKSLVADQSLDKCHSEGCDRKLLSPVKRKIAVLTV